MIYLSDYVLLQIWLNVCMWFYVNVCMVFLCACMLSYLLWRVSYEREGMSVGCLRDGCLWTYIYMNNFLFVIEWFAECRRRHTDECSGYSCRITQSLLKKAWITTILYSIYWYCIISFYHITYFITSYILLLIANLFTKGNNGKVKLERSRLWQLGNSRRKACERCWWWQHHPRFVFLWSTFSLRLCWCRG